MTGLCEHTANNASLISRETRQPFAAYAVVASRQVVVSHFLSHTACLRSSMSEVNETVGE